MKLRGNGKSGSKKSSSSLYDTHDNDELTKEFKQWSLVDHFVLRLATNLDVQGSISREAP